MSNRGKKFPVEVLTTDEIASLLSSFPDTAVGCRNRALIAVFLYSQIRCKEALDARACDVDLMAGTITVLAGKRGKRRLAALGRQGVPYVQEWVAIRPEESPYFFCTSQRGRMHENYVRRMIKRHGRKAGIKKRTHAHGCRHAGAFHLANAGVDIRMLQRQLGHGSLAVTERYISHLCPAKMIDEIRKTEW